MSDAARNVPRRRIPALDSAVELEGASEKFQRARQLADLPGVISDDQAWVTISRVLSGQFRYDDGPPVVVQLLATDGADDQGLAKGESHCDENARPIRPRRAS